MTDARNRRLRRAVVLGAAAMVTSASLPAAATAADSSGLWIGSTYMKESRTAKWAGATDSSRGDFWFRVGENGQLHGFAVVADEPTFDVERLNNLINYLAHYVGTTVGVLPLPAVGA